MRDKYELPIFPITSANDLQPTLESFRAEALAGSRVKDSLPKISVRPAFLSSYVEGVPLSLGQADILSGITSSLADLIQKVSTSEGRKVLLEYLGEQAGSRVIAYFTQEFWLL